MGDGEAIAHARRAQPLPLDQRLPRPTTAVAKVTADSGLLHRIVHSDDGTAVVTEGGAAVIDNELPVPVRIKTPMGSASADAWSSTTGKPRSAAISRRRP